LLASGCFARVLWSSFKRLSAACSESEEDDPFLCDGVRLLV
jgi:hypothetical protein